MPPKKPFKPMEIKKEQTGIRQPQNSLNPPAFANIVIEKHSAPGKNIRLEKSQGAGHFKYWVRVFEKNGDFKGSFGCYDIEHARRVLTRLGVVKK
ncbi:MAG: hypothetical protein Q7R70_01265 [Candidatus Diapherotrites archaeon]|nr:hypothetical protein [Candidatus Diapherotrites archaeon]